MIKHFYDIPGFTFDLQLFAGDAGAGEGGSGAGDGSGDGSATFIEKVDPVTGKPVKIPAELDKVLGHFISKTRSEVEGKYKPIIEGIESEKADFVAIKAEYEKMKEASMSAEERAQANAKKVIDEAVKRERLAMDDAKTWKTRFEKSTIQNDILTSFGKTELCNPGQVAMLLEAEGRARISEVVDDEGKPTGRFETRLTLELQTDKGETETVEGSPTELFKRWIALDRNAHHMRNELASGSGSRAGVKPGGKFSSAEFQKLPPVERMRMARESAGTK